MKPEPFQLDTCNYKQMLIIEGCILLIRNFLVLFKQVAIIKLVSY